MRCKLPAHLYIRCDRDLRARLNAGAQAAGENVSAFARARLREALAGGPDNDQPPPAAPAAAAAAMPRAA